MSSFTQCPPLKAIPPLYNTYCTTQAFTYYIGEEGYGQSISILKGYITDGASIPKWAWSLIGGPLGKYSPAAVVHDYILQHKLFSRKMCDLIFYEALTVLKVPWWKRKAMYVAVRVKAGWNALKGLFKGKDEDTNDIVH